MKVFYIITGIALLLFVSSCKKESGCRRPHALDYSPAAEIGTATCQYPSLSLEVQLMWGNTPFELGRIYSVNNHNTAIKTFQFYLSNLTMYSDTINGIEFNEVLSPNYLLVKPDQTNFSLGELPSKYVDRFSFLLGIDEANNGNNIYLSDSNHPLYDNQSPNMYWNSIDGYIFLNLKGNVDRNGDGIPNQNEVFDFEIGTNDLRQSFAFAPNFQIDQVTHTITMQVDLQALFNNVDLQTEQSTYTTNDPALATKIMDNLAGAITVQF